MAATKRPRQPFGGSIPAARGPSPKGSKNKPALKVQRLTTASASRAGHFAGSIPVARGPSPNGSIALLPLNCFRMPETLMELGFRCYDHRTLPPLLPSKNKRICWRGRWTWFDGRLLQRIDRQLSPRATRGTYFEEFRYIVAQLRFQPLNKTCWSFEMVINAVAWLRLKEPS